MKHYSRFIMLIIFIMVIGCNSDKVIIDNDPPDNDSVKEFTLRILVTTTDDYLVRDARVEIRGYFMPNRDILTIVVGWTDTMGRLGPDHLTVEEPKDTVYVNVTKDGYYPADTSFRVLEDGQDINLHLKMQEIQP